MENAKNFGWRKCSSKMDLFFFFFKLALAVILAASTAQNTGLG